MLIAGLVGVVGLLIFLNTRTHPVRTTTDTGQVSERWLADFRAAERPGD
jgi:hypothetical protein